MEHTIGTEITLPDGRKAEVVEQKYGCVGCIYYVENGGYCIKSRDERDCYNFFRTDHTNIIYKEVKEK